MHPFEDGFVQTSYGRLHYLTSGKGKPLILLHSNGGSAYEFEYVLEGLGKQFCVIAWDMPGQGDSDPLLKHLSVEEYAGAVVEFMDGLGIEKAHIAGASIGGAICVALGAHYGARCTSLSIVECPVRSAVEWRSNWETTEANYAPVTQTLERIAPRLRIVTPELLKRWNIDRSKAGSKTTLSVMWALREYNIAHDLPLVPLYQQVVYGSKGPTIAKIEQMRLLLRDPSIVVMDDCGHFPMIDAPEEFINIIASAAGYTAK